MAIEIPDSNPVETQEWLESVDAVVEYDGRDRMGYLLDQAIDHAQEYGVKVSAGLSTPVREHDPGRRGAGAAGRPRAGAARDGARALERDRDRAAGERGVVRARRPHRELPVGRDALRGRLQPLLARAAPRSTAATSSTCRATRRPGIYARAFLEGRLSEEQLRRFRQEVDGGGLSSYPHPWLMPDFWQFPTVSMGLGPLMAIYQARFMKYLAARGDRRHRATARSGPSWATARWTSPSRWARSRSPAARSSTTSSSSSTATCSASTGRCAATARSSRSWRRTSAAPAGT